MVEKKNYYKKSIISLMISSCIFMGAIATVNAGTLSMTSQAQEKSNWCWVAVAQMIGNYKGNYKTQSTICKEVKGSIVDEGGTNTEVASAIRYTTGKNVAINGVLPLTEIMNEIDNRDPVAIKMMWNTGGAHAVVVSGYSGGQVQLIDPGMNCSTSFYNFVDLCSGTKIQSGTGYYAITWTY